MLQSRVFVWRTRLEYLPPLFMVGQFSFLLNHRRLVRLPALLSMFDCP